MCCLTFCDYIYDPVFHDRQVIETTKHPTFQGIGVCKVVKPCVCIANSSANMAAVENRIHRTAHWIHRTAHWIHRTAHWIHRTAHCHSLLPDTILAASSIPFDLKEGPCPATQVTQQTQDAWNFTKLKLFQAQRGATGILVEEPRVWVQPEFSFC